LPKRVAPVIEQEIEIVLPPEKSFVIPHVSENSLAEFLEKKSAFKLPTKRSKREMKELVIKTIPRITEKINKISPANSQNKFVLKERMPGQPDEFEENRIGVIVPPRPIIDQILLDEEIIIPKKIKQIYEYEIPRERKKSGIDYKQFKNPPRLDQEKAFKSRHAIQTDEEYDEKTIAMPSDRRRRLARIPGKRDAVIAKYSLETMEDVEELHDWERIKPLQPVVMEKSDFKTNKTKFTKTPKPKLLADDGSNLHYEFTRKRLEPRPIVKQQF
jgi:hypothetical protein